MFILQGPGGDKGTLTMLESFFSTSDNQAQALYPNRTKTRSLSSRHDFVSNYYTVLPITRGLRDASKLLFKFRIKI
jgi:hypothetical protein